MKKVEEEGEQGPGFVEYGWEGDGVDRGVWPCFIIKRETGLGGFGLGMALGLGWGSLDLELCFGFGFRFVVNKKGPVG